MVGRRRRRCCRCYRASFLFSFLYRFSCLSLFDIRKCLHAHTKPRPANHTFIVDNYDENVSVDMNIMMWCGYEWNATLSMWLLAIAQNVLFFSCSSHVPHSHSS